MNNYEHMLEQAITAMENGWSLDKFEETVIIPPDVKLPAITFWIMADYVVNTYGMHLKGDIVAELENKESVEEPKHHKLYRYGRIDITRLDHENDYVVDYIYAATLTDETRQDQHVTGLGLAVDATGEWFTVTDLDTGSEWCWRKDKIVGYNCVTCSFREEGDEDAGEA